jgi:hypothetical protein
MNKSQIRIIPGKSYSKSVKRIVKSCAMNNQISRFQASLMKKSIKNKMNKIVMKCLVCLQNTEVTCNKLARLKLSKEKRNEGNDSFLKKKKKKKKKKDKTAGLNLSTIKSPNINKSMEAVPIHSTPTMINVKSSKQKEPSSIQKIRKINLKRLNSLLNVSNVKKSKNSLSDFLQELY